MDVAVVELELRSARLKRGAEDAAQSLRLVGRAADEVAGKTPKAGKATDDAAKAQARAAREAAAHAQALARLQRSLGDYDSAVTTLSNHLKTLEKDSTAALRVQAQIAQINNQAKRVGEGATFSGFLQGFRNVEAGIDSLSGKLGALGNLPGLGGLSRLAGTFSTIQSSAAGLGVSVTNLAPTLSGAGAAGEVAATGIGAAGVAMGVAALGVGVLVGAAVAGTKALFDLSLAGSNYGDSLSDAALITGLSVEKLSLISGAAATADASLTDFTTAASVFGRKIEEIGASAQKSAAFTKTFGIDVAAAVAGPEQALLQFGQRLTEIESPTLRVALAKEFLGKAGAKLIPTFEALFSEGGNVEARMRSLGIEIGTTTAEAAGKLSDEVALLEVQMKSLGVQVAATTGPTFVAAVGAMQQALASLSPTLTYFSGQFSAVFAEKTAEALLLVDTLKGLAGFGLGKLGVNPAILSAGSRTGGTVSDVGRKLQSGIAGGEGAADSSSRALLEQLRQPRGGSRGGSRAVSAIPGLSSAIDFLPDAIGEIDARSKLLGRSAEDLSRQMLDAQRAVRPLEEQLRILGPAAAQARGEFLILQQAFSGRKLTPAEQSILDVTRDRSSQLSAALDSTQKQFDNTTRSIRALDAALRAVDLTARLKAAQRPDELPLLGVNARSLLGLAPAPSFGTDATDAAIRRGEQEKQNIKAAIEDRNVYLERFGQDARRTFDDLFSGIITGANGVRETFGNFFLSLGDSVARRFSESITDKLFETVLDPFFSQLERGFSKLSSYLANIFSDLLSSIAKPIGGFFGNIFGGLFGGFFADGGFIPPGRFGVVGERGPELAFGGRAGTSIFNQQQMAGGFGAPVINVTIMANDAQSFQSARSRAQVSRQMADAVNAGMRSRG